MHGKYYLTPKIKPQVTKMGNVAYTADDVLFDWTSFEIPKGTCAMTSIFATIVGTNASTGNAKNFELLFAKSIDGVAPPSLGDSNDSKAVIKTVAARPWIIGFKGVDASELEDSGDGLVSYNVLGIGRGSIDTFTPYNQIILEGEPEYGSTSGYQTIWVAGIAQGAMDFGTGVDIAGNNAVDNLAIDVDGVDADDVFAIGDAVIAFDSDGSGETTIGNVTAVTDAIVTVDAAGTLIADDDELCHLNPMVFRFGFEY